MVLQNASSALRVNQLEMYKTTRGWSASHGCVYLYGVRNLLWQVAIFNIGVDSKWNTVDEIASHSVVH